VFTRHGMMLPLPVPCREETKGRRKASRRGNRPGGEADELALHMFRQLLEPAGCQLEVISARTLAVDVLSCVQQERPAVVCVATLPPAALTRTRHLCKRLRAQSPALKIVVGRWGQDEEGEKTDDRLRSAGADAVTTSLLATRGQLLPLVQGVAPSGADPSGPSESAARPRAAGSACPT
jgi:hypothetical protein